MHKMGMFAYAGDIEFDLHQDVLAKDQLKRLAATFCQKAEVLSANSVTMDARPQLRDERVALRQAIRPDIFRCQQACCHGRLNAYSLCVVSHTPVRRNASGRCGIKVANGWRHLNDMKHLAVILTTGLIILIGIGARFAIGNVYSEAEATNLIQSLTQTGLYLGSAIAGASATTLALMLTLLGLTNQTQTDFDSDVYRSISQVAWLSTISLVGAVILLLMLVLPVGEFNKMPDGWYRLMYEVIFALTVLVCALLTATVVRLFMTIRRVISQVTPGDAV